MDFYKAMQEVLQRSRYDKLTGRAFDLHAFMEDAVTRFIEFLIRRFNWRFDGTFDINTRVLSWVFILLGVAVVAAAGFFIVRRLLHLRRVKKTPPWETDVMEEIARRDLTAAQWLNLSQQYYDRGAFREAVRYRYIGVLVALHEKRIIRLGAYKTNAQIAKELAASTPALSPFFQVTTDCFHRIWFGYKALEEDEYRRFSAAVRELAS